MDLSVLNYVAQCEGDHDDDSTVEEILSHHLDQLSEDGDDGDRLVRQMMKMMKQHAGTVSKILVERAKISESICWLARHVPFCVLKDLLKDVEEGLPISLPYTSYRKCALLFVDISGFTKLSQILSLENLSKTINSYFEMIIEKVFVHGGDVLKFAGDSIFVEWAVMEHGLVTIEQCTALAALCAASVAQSCRDFPIFVGEKTVGFLNLHCSLGVGDVAVVHFGDDRIRREFLLLGDPIDQIRVLDRAVKIREVAASPEAIAILAKTFDIDTSVCPGVEKVAIIVDQSGCRFKPRLDVQLPLPNEAPGTDRKEIISMMCQSLDVSQLKHLLQLISLYVHPIVAKDELAIPDYLKVNSSALERMQAEAELRDVYTMFIMPLISSELKRHDERNQVLFQRLNNILLITNRELENYGGHLRQFIVDDKGVVLIATFGLRGATFPNMISCHCLPCTTAIHNALQVELGIDCQIGGTFGRAYCGVVGGISRHEYAVLGPCVNLSARLMCSACNPGILVDNNVRLRAKTEFTFNSLHPVTAKGYANPVPIFEPISAAEKRWGKPIRDFVGRKKQLNYILRWAKHIVFSKVEKKSKMLFIQAESGFGKSALISQVVLEVRKKIFQKKKRVIITRNISNDGDRMIPFSMFRCIFKDILCEMRHSEADDSASVISSSLSSSEEIKDLEIASIGEASTTANTMISTSSIAERFRILAKEVDAPVEFLEIAGHHLLGIHDLDTTGVNRAANKNNMMVIVDVMARAFLRCTAHADLVMMVLDDVHMLDELSWRVVQRLFQEAGNLFIICASRPVKSHKINIDPIFWSELHEQYSREFRFSDMHLMGLPQNEILHLVSKRLGYEARNIDMFFCVDLHAKSGGMPHFATQMLDIIKKSNLFGEIENGKVGWRKDIRDDELPDFNFSTVGELIVHKIDSLDASVRTTLHLCSVLGPEFELSDIMSLHKNWLRTTDNKRGHGTKLILNALNIAVNERIIEEVYEGGEINEEEPTYDDIIPEDEIFYGAITEKSNQLGNVSYRFLHDIWRESILKLMLVSHKQDLHRIIAESLDLAMTSKGNECDYHSMIKLFGHRKESGNISKTISLALKIGRSFMNTGMSAQALTIFDEGLDFLCTKNEEESDKLSGSLIAGFSQAIIAALDLEDLKLLVKIHIEKGKCMSNLDRPSESVQAYNDSLLIIDKCPSANELKDRSITFPIFSGLFVLIKANAIVQDSYCSYEQSIVRRFVEETKLHGNPVHYGRALGMQAEVCARLGKITEAMETVDVLSNVYRVEDHSSDVCKAYGSDRCAQIFSLAAMWCLGVGNEKRSIELCNFVIEQLLPNMDIRNVHNSLVLLWPLYLVLKERGETKKMRMLLDTYLFKPFDEYFGDGRTTVFLSLYKPAGMLLELCGDGEINEFYEKVEWILSEGAGIFSGFLDSAIGNYGLTCSQVVAEICLYLTKRVSELETKCKLIAKGTALARLAAKRCKGEDDLPRLPFAFERCQPMLEELEMMATLYSVSDEIISKSI